MLDGVALRLSSQAGLEWSGVLALPCRALSCPAGARQDLREKHGFPLTLLIAHLLLQLGCVFSARCSTCRVGGGAVKQSQLEMMKTASS